ncbi:hypothetical protein DID88_001202 [Monilinia fructigena]|uniref:Cytosolic Fe-S cluster assembly factor NAR1 n=1 Tax=Monilinia fructigena TaxID=38457 RepID=A0A395IXV7_9HELO|nr:hypothetical protein DID88_001202 [Monilinia fructigena]
MSAILSADDLNDFISPGVACIKPIETLPAAKPSEDNELEISFNTDAPLPSDLPPAQISLTDCLACSGCVTSAEAVLVSLQSHAEVLSELDSAPGLRLHKNATGTGVTVEGIEQGGKIYVASISPQSRASIAATFGVTEREAGFMIEHLLSGPKGIKNRAVYRNAFQWVVDTNLAREACLVLGAEEAMASMNGAEGPKKPILTSSCPGWDMACGGTGTRGVRDVDSVITSKELLMLADSRRVDFSKLPRTPLPSSSRIPFPDPKIDSFLFPSNRRSSGNGNREAGSSGGNLHYILQYFASQNKGSSVQMTKGRNADVIDYAVVADDGEILLKAARYYGFRNIQNLVRRLKPAKPSRMPGGKPIGSARRTNGKATGPDYTYVEVMACPGGCTNGGGQIKVDDPININRLEGDAKAGPQEQKMWLAQVDEAYFSEGDAVESPNFDDRKDLVEGISPSYIKDTLSHWATTTRIDLDRLVHTTYREVV